MRQPGLKEKYMASLFPCENTVMKEIREALTQDGLGGIQISESDARLLQFLIRLHQTKLVVEIGTLYGYSTLALAQALPQDGQIWSVDVNPQHHQKAQSFLKKTPQWSKIQLLTGEAQLILPKLKGPFDLVLIDADKASYLKYLDWAEQNVRPGGLIIGDNTFLFDTLWGGDRGIEVSEISRTVMAEFNRRLANPEHYNSAIIPTQEGLSVGQRSCQLKSDSCI